jgi:thioredoxin
MRTNVIFLKTAPGERSGGKLRTKIRRIEMSAAPAITADKFEDEVLKSEIPVMVDFWAEWCGPCKALSPTVDAIAEEYAGKIKVFKLDVQTEAALAGKYGVSSIPTLLIFKSGEVADRIVGLQPKANITGRIASLLE